jgi:hypothetical protein
MLELMVAVVAILGPVMAGVVFVYRSLRKRREGWFQHMQGDWTNEGSVSGYHQPFVTIGLRDKHGDLVGALKSPEIERDLDVHVNIGWLGAKMYVSIVQGKRIDRLATARVRIKGNNNRLYIDRVRGYDVSVLPRKGELWPVPELPSLDDLSP